MFWISFVGTQKEAEEYQYSIKIMSGSEWKNTGREKYLLIGRRECNSCDLSHEDVKESGRAVFLDRTLLEKAAADGNDDNKLEIYWTLEIKKK